MKKHKLIIGIGLVLFIIVGFFAFNSYIYWQKQGPSPDVRQINSFEECAKYYPVMESYPQQCNAGGKHFVEDIGNELEKLDLIKIKNPRPNQIISSPLEVVGTARGTWFFEAIFPVILLDQYGIEVAKGYAEAKDDWTTDDFIPFKATIEFDDVATDKGKLILKKDNPSGLPENDDELIVPVRF